MTDKNTFTWHVLSECTDESNCSIHGLNTDTHSAIELAARAAYKQMFEGDFPTGGIEHELWLNVARAAQAVPAPAVDREGTAQALSRRIDAALALMNRFGGIIPSEWRWAEIREALTGQEVPEESPNRETTLSARNNELETENAELRRQLAKANSLLAMNAPESWTYTSSTLPPKSINVLKAVDAYNFYLLRCQNNPNRWYWSTSGPEPMMNHKCGSWEKIVGKRPGMTLVAYKPNEEDDDD